jgi:hypothetical protein
MGCAEIAGKTFSLLGNYLRFPRRGKIIFGFLLKLWFVCDNIPIQLLLSVNPAADSYLLGKYTYVF